MSSITLIGNYELPRKFLMAIDRPAGIEIAMYTLRGGAH